MTLNLEHSQTWFLLLQLVQLLFLRLDNIHDESAAEQDSGLDDTMMFIAGGVEVSQTLGKIN